MRAALLTALGAAVIVVSFSAETRAVSDEKWCRRYARDAAAQFEEASKFNNCRRKRNVRWNDDELSHFDWCRKADDDTAMAEDRGRRRFLTRCKAGPVDE